MKVDEVQVFGTETHDTIHDLVNVSLVDVRGAINVGLAPDVPDDGRRLANPDLPINQPAS